MQQLENYFNMRFNKYINEDIKSKLIKGPMGKVRVIEGYKNYKRLYVHKVKKFGIMVTDNLKYTLDDMIEINGNYWFNTLKDLHKALNI